LYLGTQVNRIKGIGWLAIDTTLGSVARIINSVATLTNNVRRVVPDLKSLIDSTIADIKDGIDRIKGSVAPQDTSLRALRRLLSTLFRIQIEQVLRDSVSSNQSDTVNRINQAYRGTNGLQTQNTNQRVGQGTVHAGETIRSIARRLTGDESNWRSIVQINDLRPPYITSNPSLGTGVLKVGDPILYPVNSNIGLDPTSLASGSLPSTEDMSNQDQSLGGAVIESYGRDLRLISVEAGTSIDLTDIEVNQRGDLSTIVGVPNVSQAIRIKFATEQGTLPHHPYFGALYSIGSKMTPISFNGFRLSTISTFSSDSRISKIEDLKFLASGDVLSVSARLTLSDSSNFLNTNFDLRRF
jgi:hypothetical protein